MPITLRTIDGTLSCRVRTTEMADANPYGFRVGWIHWDSPFRAAGLKIEDRIIAVNGIACDRNASRAERDTAIGQAGEPRRWSQIGAHEGDVVVLEVKRDREILPIRGSLAAERQWLDGSSKLMSATGPERSARDGFVSTWSSWYEQRIVDAGWKILDGSWRRSRLNTRTELQYHRESAARVAYLVEKYPGVFANSVAADHRAIEECLAGRRYELSDADLEWRLLGEVRAARVRQAAQAARADLLERITADRIEAFPAADALNAEARAAVAGKVVVLPNIEADSWCMSAGRPWIVAAGEGGRYFIAVESPPLHRFFVAKHRYSRSVQADVTEELSLIGRIRPDPKMFVREARPLPGLELHPIAVSAGKDVFVDLSDEADATPRFAGEESLVNLIVPPPADDASPIDVMNAFFYCLKIGEEDEWRAFFASWDASRWDDRVYFYALRRADDHVLSNEWVRARRLIEGRVQEVRAVWESEVELLLSANDIEGAPEVEQVFVEVDHVALFDGELRAFADASVNRMWTLQRLGGGPWRIAANSRNGL
jgi:hypothetical protein